MGRRPTAHSNMPPGMRPRQQRSGKVYYYLDMGGKPRKEVPLGDDYLAALRKYSELLESQKELKSRVTFGDVARAYLTREIRLLVNERGGRLTKGALRYHFEKARADAAKQHPERAAEIEAFWLYDLRAKTADDVADALDDQAAANLLGHNDVQTTRRHYLRRGRKVAPVK